MLACLALAVACALNRSLYPLYTNRDVVRDPALLGTWEVRPVVNSSALSWVATFSAGGRRGYDLAIGPPGREPSAFEAYVVQLGTHRFLDVFPSLDPDPLLAYHTIPAHSFWKMSASGDGFHLVGLNTAWLADQEDDRVRGNLVTNDRGLQFLTTMTHELQAFILENADNESAFPPASSLELKRRE